MLTPCVNICQVHAGKCIGCGRTLEEIEQWPFMDDNERSAIINRLKRPGVPTQCRTDPPENPA
jgi:predicted Fe-S protein YdhL (DUF1289 family)